MIEAYEGTLPVPTPETQPFWDATLEDRLLLPHCRDCGGWTYYPRPFCMHCFSKNIEWREASGKGTLHSFAINHLPAKGFPAGVPIVIAVVALEEGPRMITNLAVEGIPSPEDLQLDSQVQVTFRHVSEDLKLPWFRVVQ